MSERLPMRFRGHDTFFIRKGWLSKGLDRVVKDPEVFKSTTQNPMDVLGIGANMVKSLRYWLVAVGLTTEKQQKRQQELTPLGRLILQYDPYLEEVGTLWLLHYRLASNRSGATSWWYFFNEFSLQSFDKEDFLRGLDSYVRLQGGECARRSLEDDFNCLISFYMDRVNKHVTIHPENNIQCPFVELGLLGYGDISQRLFRKTIPKLAGLDPLVVLAVIVDNARRSSFLALTEDFSPELPREIRISSLLHDANNVGRVFNLDASHLYTILGQLELRGLVRVVRTAGLDVLVLEQSFTFEACVQLFYESLDASGEQ